LEGVTSSPSPATWKKKRGKKGLPSQKKKKKGKKGGESCKSVEKENNNNEKEEKKEKRTLSETTSTQRVVPGCRKRGEKAGKKSPEGKREEEKRPTLGRPTQKEDLPSLPFFCVFGATRRETAAEEKRDMRWCQKRDGPQNPLEAGGGGKKGPSGATEAPPPRRGGKKGGAVGEGGRERNEETYDAPSPQGRTMEEAPRKVQKKGKKKAAMRGEESRVRKKSKSLQQRKEVPTGWGETLAFLSGKFPLRKKVRRLGIGKNITKVGNNRCFFLLGKEKGEASAKKKKKRVFFL